MTLLETLKSSLTTLKMNGRRTFLTMFGIIIGIAAVIIVLAIGNGLRVDTMENVVKDPSGRLGENFFYTGSIEIDADGQSESPFNQEDIQGLKDNIAEIDDVVIEDRSKEQSDWVFPVNSAGESETQRFALVEATDLPILVGRNLSVTDNEEKSPYVVIGKNLAEENFGSVENAYRKPLHVGQNTLTIIGVYDEEEREIIGRITMDSEDSDAFATVGSITKGYFDLINPLGSTSEYLRVFYKPDVDMKIASEKVAKYLKENGSMKDKGSYEYFDSAAMSESIGKMLGNITLVISAIAGISLFIAGVGVMNMMYTSVSERIEEIGIRRAIGATKSNIALQFLAEGVAITTVGGLIGLLLGMGIGNLIGAVLPFDPVVDLKTALICMAISMGIGIVFSVLPARSAANRNLIDILR